ncbi:protein lateral root primordium 1 [Tanacetum coccineum]
MYDNFQIQFGRKEFCLVIGLKFGVEYSDDYDDTDKPIPFRRRVFPSCLDGKRITGKDVEDLIESKSFKKLDDDDAVSLCCICILQLVLLGLEDRRCRVVVPIRLFRLANDRDGHNEYYTRHLRYPRIVAWTSNKKFYRPMLRDFLHGRVPAERLIPDEVEAGSVPEFFGDNSYLICVAIEVTGVDYPTMKVGCPGDQMNAWIEILIRSRPQDADWTVSKSGTTCVHPENNRMVLDQTDPHIIVMLDGSTSSLPILEKFVATSRSSRLPSDSGAFADWVANPSSSSALRSSDQDLSLGFNAGPPTASAGMWSNSSTTSTRQINYGLPEMGMLGLRDVFVVADPHGHPHSITNASVGRSVGVGVIPLLSTTPCLEEDMLNSRGRGNSNTNNNYSIQFWQQHPQTQPHNYLNKPMISDHGFLQASVGGSSSTSGSTLTCQDCGNQAKKDCTHRRCRTCCKSRGYDCSTHVKSTWVPAARRRERQHMTPTGLATVSSATSGLKKPRLTSHTTTTSHTSTSNTTPPRSYDTSSSHHQDASFKESLPGQIRAPAVFKCVRVTAVEDGDDEYAYQASATIGGHVFKGFLYDQGVETRDQSNFPNFSELHLGGNSSGGGGRNVGGSTSLPLLDPSDVYASSGGGLITGSNYGNTIN